MPRHALSLSLVACALTLAACASDPGRAHTEAGIRKLDLSGGTLAIARQEGRVELLDDKRVTCERYKPLGSNLTKIRCQTVSEKVSGEEANAREMRKLQYSPPNPEATLTRAPWDRGNR